MLHVEPITSLSVHMGFMGPRAFVISAVATWTRGWGFRKRDRTREEENSGRSSISTPIPSFPTPTRAFTRILDFQRDFQPRSILNLERSFIDFFQRDASVRVKKREDSSHPFLVFFLR